MSTTARKLRKRNGLKFVHPTKELTPIHERIENQPRNVVQPDGHMRYGVSTRGRKRLNGAAQRLIEGKLEGEQLALDPKPFRIGRKRYSLDELADRSIESEAGQAAVFSPRKGYAADSAAYTLDA